MSQVAGLAQLGRQILNLPSVHMGNFNLLTELIFQPGYCPYGKFQLIYQYATFQISSQ